MIRPLLSLVMMVKDEAASIRGVLEAAKPFVDRWTILDTGSTDGTQDIIREVMADKLGRLVEEPFIGCSFAPNIIDFAATRNRVLALDSAYEPAVFQLMLSGDEFLDCGAELREHLQQHRDSDVDLHFVCVYLESTLSPQPRVFRTGSEWRYKDELHEYPVHPDPEAKKVSVPMARIQHVVSDPERRYAAIWEKHIPVLKHKLEENENDERALMYLAQSYETLLPFFSEAEKLMYSLEAMGLCLRRLAITTGSDIERSYIQLMYLDFAQSTGIFTAGELYNRAKALVETCPRPEAALLLAQLSARAVEATEVYSHAAAAAKMADEALAQKTDTSPLSMAIAWQAHHFAAVVARQLKAKRPLFEDWGAKMRMHIAAGLAAGGSWDLFKQLDAPLESKEATP